MESIIRPEMQRRTAKCGMETDDLFDAPRPHSKQQFPRHSQSGGRFAASVRERECLVDAMHLDSFMNCPAVSAARVRTGNPGVRRNACTRVERSTSAVVWTMVTGGSGFVYEQVDMRFEEAARAKLNDPPRHSTNLD
jgi:hypothetical protein